MRILLADDEWEITRALKIMLERSQYTVDVAEDGAQALDYLENGSYDAVVLDVMMPQVDGLTVLRRMRAAGDHTPTLLLTAKADDMDKLMGFEQGADDYLTKPFNILELKARVRALLRRAGPQQTEQRPNKLTHGHITVDVDGRNAYKGDVLVDLTAKEFDLIELLMRNPNRVYSRESLLDTIWGYEYRSDIRTVDVHIRRLREKLENNPASPEYILTKWGVGYYFKA